MIFYGVYRLSLDCSLLLLPSSIAVNVHRLCSLNVSSESLTDVSRTGQSRKMKFYAGNAFAGNSRRLGCPGNGTNPKCL